MPSSLAASNFILVITLSEALEILESAPSVSSPTHAMLPTIPITRPAMVSDQTEIKRSMTSAATWPDSGPTLVSPPTPTKFPTMYFHHSYQLQNPGADASISSGLGPYSAVTSAHSSAQSGRAKNAHMAKTAMGTNTMPKKKKARKAGQQLGHLKCDERTLEAALESGAGRILILC